MKETRLAKNICETVYEGQIKLGYRKERIQLYYQLGSMQYLLADQKTLIEQTGRKELTGKDFDPLIPDLEDQLRTQIGEVKITRQKQRLEIIISAEAVANIYENRKQDTFLEELIQILAQSQTGLTQVMDVFRRKSPDVICEKAPNDEFDYVIYFKDSQIDDFRYCFSFGEMGNYYHRFIPYDYDTVIES